MHTPLAAANEPFAPVLRRILLVTARSSSLVALQRACRRERGLQLRFYTHPVAALPVVSGWRPDAVLIDVSCIGGAADALVERARAVAPSAPIAVLGDLPGNRLAAARERIGADGAIALSRVDALASLQAMVPRSVPVRVDVA